MLGKLMKHELKATSRYFLLLYGALLLLTIFNKIFLLIGINEKNAHDTLGTALQILWICFLTAYVLICAAVFIMTFVFIVMRFYKNLTGDEGYLMHTLPVTSYQHILSKLLISAFWNLCSMVSFIISLVILFWGYEFWDAMKIAFSKMDWALFQELKPQFVMMAILFVFALIIGTFQNILLYYLCICIGHLFNKHRILGSIAAFFGISFLLQMISSIGSVSVTFRMNTLIDEMESNLILFSESQAVQKVLGYTNALVGIGLLLAIAVSVLYFFITNYILSKKLNLE